MLDSLKTVSAGAGAIMIDVWNLLPDLISLGIGFLTLFYLILKIKGDR